MPKTKETKRIEAEQRQNKRDNRTNGQQLALIAVRRGNSAKEAARLSK